MKKSLKVLFLTFVFLSIFGILWGNETQTTYLQEINSLNKLRFRDLVLPLALENNLVKQGTSVEDANNILIKLYPKLKQISQKKYLQYNDIALICMQIYQLEGGLFYSITENRHYSFRELQYKGLISDDIDPMKIISGKQTYELLLKAAKL
ncbi:MAG: hypothetical protein IJ937_07585 [Treponema sp.]|nr:hypothetical protein [Treponema sp.]MBR4011549.1 hypothetical protein [Spirochaetaceae bacterium]